MTHGQKNIKLATSCLSVRMEQLGSHYADFYEILYLRIFRKSAKKIHFSFKADQNNGFFTWRPINIFYPIFISSSYKEK